MKEELSKQILNTVRQFIKIDVAPVVKNLEDKIFELLEKFNLTELVFY